MFENPRRGRQARNFTTKCCENSRSQIVFRTDIFRKLPLGAPIYGKCSSRLTVYKNCDRVFLAYDFSGVICMLHISNRLLLRWQTPRRIPQLLSIASQVSGVGYVMRPILLIMWTAFQSLTLRDNNDTTSSRSLTGTQNADCVAVSTRPLTILSLAAWNWLKLNTSTATTTQLHTCTGRSAKRLAMRWAWTQNCHREG